MDSGIQKRLTEVEEKIHQAALRSHRDPGQIQLVVVTKGQAVEKVREVVESGAKILGENYPEETHQKIMQLGEYANTLNWHMIGHLQSRKIKFILAHFSMIHSIDSEEIAITLNQTLKTAALRLPALIEVNVSGEESKHGFAAYDGTAWPELFEKFMKLKNQCGNLKFIGLMTMPPYAEQPEMSRPYFIHTRKLMEFIQEKSVDDEFCHLSMGTSLDFEVAVEEGATYVRVGEAIMGARSYKK